MVDNHDDSNDVFWTQIGAAFARCHSMVDWLCGDFAQERKEAAIR